MRAVFKLRLRPFFINLRKRTQIIFSEKNLLYTNIGLSVGVSILGDGVQQIYQRQPEENPFNFSKWDFSRTLQMGGAGLVCGPFVHYWYYYLDKFFPGRSLRTVVIKLCLDQCVCSPFYIASFLITTGILQGQTWQEFKQECRDKTLCLAAVEFLFWPPAQLINFVFMPPQYRVLYDNIMSLFVEVLYSYVRYDYSPTSKEKDYDCADNDILIMNNEDNFIDETCASAYNLKNVQYSLGNPSQLNIKESQSSKIFFSSLTSHSLSLADKRYHHSNASIDS